MMKRRETLLTGFVLGLLFQKLRLISVVTGSTVALFLCLLAFSETSNATSITVDEIIWQAEGGTDPSKLSGTVFMSYDAGSSTLLIELTNTSTAGASTESSSLLLTALGFDLPDGLSITGGTVTMGGSTAINFIDRLGGDVSGEWGYANMQQGQFNVANSSIDTIVSSMQSSTNTKFSNGTITNPAVLNGPDFGMLSANDPASAVGNNLEAIQDTVFIHVALTTNTMTSSALLDAINDGDVVIAFGSADTSTSVIPEPATIALLGIGLVGLVGGAVRRKFKKE